MIGQSKTVWFSIALIFQASVTAIYAQQPDSLAKEVQKILEDRCVVCHANGSAEGSIDYILNRNRLVQRSMVIPGESVRSKLFRQLQTGAMPKDDDPLTAAEIALFKKWIDAGAPDWEAPLVRKTITPADMLEFMARDLKSIEDRNPRDLRFIRYLTITHLYNAGYSDGELQTYRLAMSKLVNSLSWGSRIVNPQPIDPAETVFRLDLRNYKWTAASWNRIISFDPYGVTYHTDAAKYCYEKTRSLLPYVRGDWFVAKASIPPLYHDILEIPQTDRELEKKLNIDVTHNLATDQVARAGFNGSGVSNNNRLIERHVSDLTRGAYWKSYDFKPLLEKAKNGALVKQSARNLFERPLGPIDVMPKVRLAFEHAGGELIWNLPNGLQAYMLVDEKGQRIDVGPVDIVSDPGRPDRSVINGLSCMSCHAAGMKDKSDLVRKTVESNANAYSAAELELVRALYPTEDQFQQLLDEDRQRFTQAVQQTGGKVGDTDPVVVLAQRFEGELDLKLAAAEVGISPDELLDGMSKSNELARLLGPLRVPTGTVKRDQFISAFSNAVEFLELGEYMPPIVVPENHSKFSELEGNETGEVRADNALRLKLLWCPPGRFLLGNPDADGIRVPWSEKQLSVTLTSGFWLGQTEVTQQQWEAVMKDEPWKEDDSLKTGPDFPASFVSQNDALIFCKKLTESERAAGRLPADWEYTLPTDAQWEYACRAGTTTARFFGEDIANLDQYAWFDQNTVAVDENYPHEVGLKKPNPWGFHDMYGNLWEWCRDGRNGERKGGVNPENKFLSGTRVFRGGAWNDNTKVMRSAVHYGHGALRRTNTVGFRLTLSRYDEENENPNVKIQPERKTPPDGAGGGFF